MGLHERADHGWCSLGLESNVQRQPLRAWLRGLCPVWLLTQQRADDVRPIVQARLVQWRVPPRMSVGRSEVSSLLDKGADVDAQNRDGETCLMYACRMAQAAMVRLLLARGAQISTQDKYGDTAADHCDNDKRLMHWLELHFAREHQAKDAREGREGVPVLPSALPVAVLVPIMAFLSPKEVGRSAVVCGAWHRACEEEAIWNQKGFRRWQVCVAKSSVERMAAHSLAGPLRPKSK